MERILVADEGIAEIAVDARNHRHRETRSRAITAITGDHRGPQTAPLLRGLGWDYGDPG